MENLNFNLNNKHKYQYNQPNFKSNPVETISVDLSQVQLPDMYYTPSDNAQPLTLKESIKKADMMGFVYPWIEHPILMLGTSAGLAYSVDKFSKSCGGDYEKSLLGRAAKFGDRIQESKFIKSNAVQKTFDAARYGKKQIAHFFRNSDVINAIMTTPSLPQNSLVKNEMFNQGQRLAEEFSRITTTLKLTEDGIVQLKDLGMDKKEFEMLKQTLGTTDLSKVSHDKIVNTLLLKRLGKSDTEVASILNMGEGAVKATKKEIIKELGLSEDKLNKIKKDPTKYVDEVHAAVERVKGRVKIGAGHYRFLGPFQPFERTIGCDEIFNRFHSMTNGAKTGTGRFMSKFLQKLHRGFTFGGGKLGVLMFVTPHIVETIIDTKKADSDQKVGTAAHGLVEAVSWVFTFPLALKIMHSLCGAQYAGMTKDKIEEVRKIKNEFNNTTFKNYDEWKARLIKDKARVKELEKVEGQNLLTKICRKLGKFVTIDLERFKSYRNGTMVGNTFRKLPGAFKNIAGVPMRLGIWGVLSMGVLGGIITKGTKMLFGNYYDRFKEEEHENNKQAQKEFLKDDLQKRLLETQARKNILASKILEEQKVDPLNIEENNKTLEFQQVNDLQQVSQNAEKSEVPEVVLSNNENNNSTNNANGLKSEVEDSNDLESKQYGLNSGNAMENLPVEEKYIPSQDSVFARPVKNNKRDNYTYIPSSENVLAKNNEKTLANKYIPSQTGSNFVKTFDNSGLESALRRADRAEQRALETLAGNFGY